MRSRAAFLFAATPVVFRAPIFSSMFSSVRDSQHLVDVGASYSKPSLTFSLTQYYPMRTNGVKKDLLAISGAFVPLAFDKSKLAGSCNILLWAKVSSNDKMDAGIRS